MNYYPCRGYYYKQLFMKRTLIVLVACCLISGTIVYGQKPEPVYSMTKEIKPREWYESQATAWEKITKRTPKNTAAWFNFYMANRMMRIYDEDGDVAPVERFKMLNSIVDQMEKHIPGSYEYHYTRWYNSSNDPAAFTSLEKAYQLDPVRPETYSGLVTYYELKRDLQHRDEILRKWFESRDPIPGLLHYNYNVLMSLDANAILLTAGDNDTYPAWILQAARNIRPDVMVINIHMLLTDDYRKQIFSALGATNLPLGSNPDTEERQAFRKQLVAHIAKNQQGRPVYVAVTASGSAHTEAIQDKLYLTGLAYRYSEQKIDNLALLRKNFEQRFILDYQKIPLAYEPFQNVVDLANGNYVVPAMNLYEHYRTSGEMQKAKTMKEMALQLAGKAGFGDEVKVYFENQTAQEHDASE